MIQDQSRNKVPSLQETTIEPAVIPSTSGGGLPTQWHVEACTKQVR